MSTRKHRASQPLHTESSETSNQETPSSQAPAQGRGTSPSGAGKSPVRFMFFLWGLPLILFIVIAVVKQCEW